MAFAYETDWAARHFPTKFEPHEAIMRAGGLPMVHVPSAPSAWSPAVGAFQSTVAPAGGASFHELPQRPTFKTQQPTAFQYAGWTAARRDVLAEGIHVWTSMNTRDANPGCPASMQSLNELNTRLKDGEEGKVTKTPIALAKAYHFLCVFNADIIAGKSGQLDVDHGTSYTTGTERTFQFSAWVGGCVYQHNVWGGLMGMGTRGYLFAQPCQKNIDDRRRDEARIMALLPDSDESAKLARDTTEVSPDYVQIVPVAGGMNCKNRVRLEAMMLNPDYVYWDMGLCVDADAPPPDAQPEIVWNNPARCNPGWIGDPLVNMLQRDTDPVCCHPDFAVNPEHATSHAAMLDRRVRARLA